MRKIGWREWVKLPELGGAVVKAKIDTGARTSAIHAYNIVRKRTDDSDTVAFDLHPVQQRDDIVVSCIADVVDVRIIRNSGGTETERYIVRTPVTLGKLTWDIELSLTQRDDMGFRMLLGRTAVRDHFLVAPGRSFVFGRHLAREAHLPPDDLEDAEENAEETDEN